MGSNLGIVGSVILHTNCFDYLSYHWNGLLNILQVLQREIALARALTVDQLTSPTGSVPSGRAQEGGLESTRSSDGTCGNVTGGKRKYRRHPKVQALPIE